MTGNSESEEIMKRRDFIKSGAAVVGIAGAPNLLPPLLEGEAVSQKSPKPSGKNAAAPKENRSADYLRRAKTNKFLPKPPVFAASKLTPDVDISPMPLAERLKRNIVPRKGFCSACLLYTSDAADDLLCVDLGGRRIIKK